MLPPLLLEADGVNVRLLEGVSSYSIDMSTSRIVPRSPHSTVDVEACYEVYRQVPPVGVEGLDIEVQHIVDGNERGRAVMDDGTREGEQ